MNYCALAFETATSAVSTTLSSNDCVAMLDALPYRTIVVADFEFEFGGHSSFDDASRSGERPRPVCMVARDLRSGQTWRLWRDEFGPAPPFPIGPDALFVAFYASAELGCFRALGWPKPANILDLFTEFRDRTNGVTTPAGAGLVGALTFFGLDSIGSQEKDDLRALVLRGGPWTAEERAAILDYCESDILALERLLPAMLPRIDLPRALLRGRYMAAAAAMEWTGVPIDVPTLSLLRQRWTDIQDDLIRTIDADYGAFEGRSFRAQRWAEYLVAQNIPWPRLESDRLDLSDDAFREMARIHPKVAPMRELRSALSELRLNDLAVGQDGRNRTILSAFRSRTGRNQPSNTRFIFGPSVWLRGLIQPPPGHGVAYVDWSQQEFGIAAALSGDPAMQAAYNSGDPYLTFAKQAGAVPTNATKDTHKLERELFKTCALGVQYGMEAESLARRINQPPIVARDLLRAHRETYRAFWRWSDAAVDHAMLRGSLHTVFGWHVHAGENVNPRSLRNFPMQANGAEMLRLACCLATERGIEVCAPVHDAVLICAPLECLEADVARMRTCMAEASRVVLAGLELRTDATLIRYPDRYSDPRGAVMWDRVIRLIAATQQAKRAA
jgi:DNA polymerase family A